MTKEEQSAAIRRIHKTINNPQFGERLNAHFAAAQSESEKKFKMLEPKAELLRQAYNL